MGKKTRTYFWSSWPMASQHRFFKMMLMGTIIGTLSLSVGLKLFSGSLEQRISEAKEQYGRVAPMVEETLALRAHQGNLAHLPVEEAAWSIIDDLLIEGNLVSIRSTQLDEDTEGIQVTFERLSLSKLINFMEALRNRASLQTPDCSITRNPDDPRLADAHFVLAR
ncbi:hypothetical protein [Pseudodesulfovibrio sp. zrk46]|uniref:hypothetical protein n=1 Tax=Pseudodesulfovibrio sp. zrk46 TaxID=2725288 RepID=UPI00144A1415|nr:hypothetical protein [Pseudodesulfovibrio sp. zrk46]QJB55966.1 hypothetical protein HFN16_05875 [Pseudodesulfovibrio sp. zrk46]